MASVEPAAHGDATTRPLDPESAEWVRSLTGAGAERERALVRLHELLLRVARGEVSRGAPRLNISGPELDDLAYQAAADAMMALTGKVGQFRWESRFTTWAYKFVIFEVSGKIGRHYWRNPDARLDAEDWDRLPDRFGFDPARRNDGSGRGQVDLRVPVGLHPQDAPIRSVQRAPAPSTTSPLLIVPEYTRR
jgi:RNA polymerase sigma-70 factor (ECF subfamily)